jgi:hypothetical protein
VRALTQRQKKHLDRIRRKFGQLVGAKYRRGAAQHGGNLWDHSALELIDEAVMETIDQFVYLMTLTDKLRRGRKHPRRWPS